MIVFIFYYYYSRIYHVQLFKLGAGQGLREIFPLKEGLDLNTSLVLGRQSSLGLLHLTTQLLHSTIVLAHIFARLLLVQLDEVIHDTLVKVFTSQMGVTIGSHHFEHAVINGQDRNVEGAATQIEHKDVLLAILLVKAISNGSSSSKKKNNNKGLNL